jgi:hypothetical protein
MFMTTRQFLGQANQGRLPIELRIGDAVGRLFNLSVEEPYTLQNRSA